jgi:phosphatidate cytidylyltransferase
VLKHRIVSGCVIGGAFLLAAFFVPLPGVWLILIALSALAQLEFYAMINMAGIPVFRILGTVCGTALITATFWTIGPDEASLSEAYKWDQFILLATLIAVFVRQFPQKHNERPICTIACTLLGVWYVPYLFNFMTRMAMAWERSEPGGGVSVTGRLLILYFVVVTKCSDIGAYFVGRALGRHKLFPRISPKKTWEGLLGGGAAAVAASVGFQTLTEGKLGMVRLGLADAVMLGLLLTLWGVVGDMFESLLKRAAGIKDSSSAIPGMGGWLDVFDSLLFGAPAMYVYVRLFVT